VHNASKAIPNRAEYGVMTSDRLRVWASHEGLVNQNPGESTRAFQTLKATAVSRSGGLLSSGS